MKKLLLQFATLTLCTALCIPSVFAARHDDQMIQVGLVHGSGALSAANLQNNDGYGAGYRFGYFDDDLEFEELAYTDEDIEEITMLRTSEMYLRGAEYTTTQPSGNYNTIGCYHVVLDYFSDYEDALDLAEEYEDGFVAWIDGEYQVREGTYSTLEEAEEAAYYLEGYDVKGTSAYAVNVVETGTTDILFQFDGGEDLPFGVMPDVTGEDDVRTWFKGYKYRGGFRYERIDGGDLTVVNIVDMETYTKGVIPYEMNNGWPLEALKAQAVCARSYAYNCIQERSHVSSNFDICITECCQVYHGVGSGNSNYQANERTDRAVEETEGMYALYDGEPIWAYYSSSHGGASESIKNAWNGSLDKFPYICGVIDPYEQNVAHLNSYSYWKVSYTKSELTKRLQERGYGIGTTVSSLDITYSERGNVIQVKVNYANGKSNTLTPAMSWGVKSLFGVSSLHYTVNGQDASSGTTVSRPSSNGITVNEEETLDTDSRLYVISGNGKTARIDVEEMYIISGDGTTSRLDGDDSGNASITTPTETVVTVSGNNYVVEGAGNGHQLGMSQYGAYAMAEEGFDYDEIVEFYYPGAEVDTY